MYRETSCGRQESILKEFKAAFNKEPSSKQRTTHADHGQLGLDEIYVDLQISVFGPR